MFLIQAISESVGPTRGDGHKWRTWSIALEVCSREPRLKTREPDVSPYLALDRETRYITEKLGANWYSARNHGDYLCVKLVVSSRLIAVMVAWRLEKIHSEWPDAADLQRTRRTLREEL